MKEIKELVEHIHEEMEDAEDYIKLALHYKETDSRLADTYARLAQEEIGHADHLHGRRSHSPCRYAGCLGMGTQEVHRPQGKGKIHDGYVQKLREPKGSLFW